MSQVLIVDDSRSIREMLAGVLANAGLSVDSAETGQQGLDKARDRMFDLVITDINMPGMDGFDLLKSLRALPQYSGRPILILTTEFSPDMKIKGRAAGATGWMVKPFDPDKVVEVIGRLLKP